MTRPDPAADLRAVFCGAESDISGALCARLDCDGTHQADGGDAWTTTTDDTTPGRTP